MVVKYEYMKTVYLYSRIERNGKESIMTVLRTENDFLIYTYDIKGHDKNTQHCLGLTVLITMLGVISSHNNDWG